MPHHHDHHHPAGRHAAHWLFSAEGKLDLAQIVSLLRKLADEIDAQGTLQLDEHTVSLPQTPLSLVRHEITPHGEEVVKIELKWPDDIAGGAATSPIAALLT